MADANLYMTEFTDVMLKELLASPQVDRTGMFLCPNCAQLHIAIMDKDRKVLGQIKADPEWLISFFSAGMAMLGYPVLAGLTTFDAEPPTGSKH